jgi:hypothetical protein
MFTAGLKIACMLRLDSITITYVKYLLMSNYFFQKRIFCFDSDSRTWTDTGIAVYGRILSTFVDEKHVMTLQVAKSQDLGKATIYRFALK